MKVLVIDEDKFVRSIYESELHQQNIQVILASDGVDGLNKAIEAVPDLIVIELILTKKNGFEVIREIKKNKDLNSIPIVVCSMLSQESDIEEVKKLGIEKYFSKEDYSIKQVVKEILDILMNTKK